jgi:L-seryl-tRNA(Ser) seleniumtransferase
MIDFKNTYLRKLPSVSRIIERPELSEMVNDYPHILIVKSIRQIIEDRKNSILKAQNEDQIKDIDLSIESIIREVQILVEETGMITIRRAINATGDVLNDDLCHDLLNAYAQKAILEVSKGYSTSFNDYQFCQLLAEITGAESGVVLNNNTAGILLTLNTICDGKEVIVSRGEIVETDESRLPDIIEKSGAKLVSVGTTNKTHLYDYQRAINENTGAIMRVNKSNFRIVGFTDCVPLTDLASLSEKSKIPLIEIIGNGCLIDLTQLGFSEEPYVPLSVKIGSDVVCFGGDRLLGGPQAGIVIGKLKYISMIQENPLYQALRPDKFAISALEATLRSYLDGDLLKHNIALTLLCRSIDEIKGLNVILIEKLKDKLSDQVIINLVNGYSKIDSLSIPPEKFPTELIAIKFVGLTLEEIARKMRMRKIPIIVNINKEGVSLDMRSVFANEIGEIAEAIIECMTI